MRLAPEIPTVAAMELRSHDHDWDVLIIGRSFAGLSAALMLGRARRSVLLVGTGGPRNEAVLHAHGLLTHDGASPGEILAAGEAQLARYPNVQVLDARVTGLEHAPPGTPGFLADLGGRPASARAVVLATGVNDDPPPIPGLADHWGRGVFTCPFCDGWEHQDQPLSVVGDPAFGPHVAQLLRSGWSDRVTLFVGTLDEEVAEGLRERGVVVDEREVVRVHGDGDAVEELELADGDRVPVGAIFVAKMPVANTALAVGLGAALDEVGLVVTDEQRSTTVPGLFAVGDVRTRMHQMSMAIADGTMAGAAATALLLSELLPVADDAP